MSVRVARWVGSALVAVMISYGSGAKAAEDVELSQIMADLYAVVSDSTNQAMEVTSEKLIEKMIDRVYKVGKITPKGREIVLRRAMRDLKEAGASGLATDLVVDAVVGAVATAVMEDILAQDVPTAVKVPLAATAYITLKSSYVFFASNGNLAALTVGQSKLLLEVIATDIKAAKEWVDAKDALNHARLRETMLSAYLDYVRVASTTVSRTEFDRAERALKDAFDAARREFGIRDVNLTSTGAGATVNGAAETFVKRPIERLFDDLQRTLLVDKGKFSPPAQLEVRFNTPTPILPANLKIDQPFIPALAAPVQQPPLQTNFAEAPAVEPSPTASSLWAGHMTLSGRTTSGVDPVAEIVGPMAASGQAPVSQFILFRPGIGAMSQPIQGVQSDEDIGHDFSHLIWGDWDGATRQWTDPSDGPVTALSGFFTYGQLTLPTARMLGTATYTGKLRGDVIEDGGTIQRGMAYGDFGLTANFSSGALGGWLAISGSNSTNYVAVTDISSARIQRLSDRISFTGNLGGKGLQGSIHGQFYGPNATEMGGGYSLASTNGQGSTHGILMGWETRAMPQRPVGDGLSIAVYHGQITSSQGPNSVVDKGVDLTTMPTAAAPVVEMLTPENSGSVTTTTVFARGDYAYASWGKWAANASSTPDLSAGGYWVAGEATWDSAVNAKTGTAQYSGEIVGDFNRLVDETIDPLGTRRAMTGTVNLTADFDNDSISGEMTMTSGAFTTGALPIDTTLNGGRFTHEQSLQDEAATYGMQGKFFGPNAEEIGGSTWAFTNDGSYNGVFRADQ